MQSTIHSTKCCFECKKLVSEELTTVSEMAVNKIIPWTGTFRGSDVWPCGFEGFYDIWSSPCALCTSHFPADHQPQVARAWLLSLLQYELQLDFANGFLHSYRASTCSSKGTTPVCRQSKELSSTKDSDPFYIEVQVHITYFCKKAAWNSIFSNQVIRKAHSLFTPSSLLDLVRGQGFRYAILVDDVHLPNVYVGHHNSLDKPVPDCPVKGAV